MTNKLTEKEKKKIQEYEKDQQHLSDQRKIINLQEQLRERDRMLKMADEQLEDMEAQVGISKALKCTEPKTYEIKPVSKQNEATAFMNLSDGHCDETVRKDEVGGINEYNQSIAEQRHIEFFRSGLQLIKIQRAGIKINNLMLSIMGDMVTGHIHEDPKQTNSMSPTQAVIFARDLIVSGIESLQKEFEQIIVPVCVGNHGQLRSGGERTLIVENNLEYLLAVWLADYFKKTNVNVIVPTGYFQWVDIYGFPIRIHHGETIRYSAGLGGLTIPAMKAINNFNTVRQAYLDMFGHSHTSMIGQGFISNGSIIGYNAFAQSIKARYEAPAQWFGLIDKKHGLTVTSKVYL